ncbi:hypothetical protein LPTSP4_19440 [Leptospira ryugenii]|uniref:Uncharacterized protein n=1 Tax=Leptospira ryugenii TaxID=1917863 RepID=A0A2P2E0M3_9LEPT|nr:hypothetical protein LPTSP4_19440 [Leptospira ryugenii]
MVQLVLIDKPAGSVGEDVHAEKGVSVTVATKLLMAVFCVKLNGEPV